MEDAPYLVVGLGNPGREYRKSRHNVGFMVIDALGKDLAISLTRVQSRAIFGSGTCAGQRVILAKPLTFMNLSGQAVNALVNFYKVPIKHLLVINDDLDLPLGALRMRAGGGSAGQKGMISIIERLGTQDFPRLRVGIGRPPGKMDAADYVLHEFPTGEIELLEQMLARACQAACAFIRDGLDKTMTNYNGGIGDRDAAVASKLARKSPPPSASEGIAGTDSATAGNGARTDPPALVGDNPGKD